MAVESLATLCVLSLIDHRDLLGDLGDMDLSLLRPVFEHCTADQLDRIENENKDRDFTPFTDDLWERCYERRYGMDGAQQVQDRMKQAKVLYTWRQLYHARQQADDRTQQKCVSRLKELYHRADEVKKQRRLQVLEKPRLSVTRRRMFSSGPSSQAAAWANKAGSSMLKKARLGYANSVQARLVSDIKKKPLNYSHNNPSFCLLSLPPPLLCSIAPCSVQARLVSDIKKKPLNYSPPRSYTHRPSSLSSSPAARATSRAAVSTSPAVTRQLSSTRAFSGQISANHSPHARLSARESPSGRGFSEPARAMGMEARGQVREQARGSAGAGILNIVDHRGGFVGAEETWEGGKRRCRDGEGSRERRMNSGIDRDRNRDRGRDWEWESGGGESGEEERDTDDHEEDENHGKRRRETDRGRGRGNGGDAEQDGEWNRDRSKGCGRGGGGGNDRRQADGLGGRSKSSPVQAGSMERVAERGAGSFKGKRKFESSMDWGV
ncbi:unnamed protein product [Closterium sp. Naga37s-1]|nr:unnamed protein product [Closterium sp. Naga37s-1]